MINFVIFLSILELTAQFFLKVAKKRYIYITIGVLLYAFIGYIYYLGILKNKFGSMSLAWHVMMAVATIFISVFIFKEHYSKREVIGLIFGIISLILLNTHH